MIFRPLLAPPMGANGGQMGPNPIFCLIFTIFTMKGPNCQILTMAKSNLVKVNSKTPFCPLKVPNGGAKLGLKVIFSKIWLHHCSKLPKRSLPCEYGNDWAKNRIWPHLAPFGTFRGAKRGLRDDFFQIWLQIHS